MFMDTQLEQVLDEGKAVFGKEIDDLLRDLRKATYAAYDERSDAELLDAPDMQIIREKAAHILQLIENTGKTYPFAVEI